MSTREKLEKVLEFIINEENDKASDLLHDVFVEKARGIYEEIATEDEELEEATDEDVEEVDEAKNDDDDDKEQVDEADIQDEFADEIETDAEQIDQEEVAEDDMEDEMPMDDEGMEDDGDDSVDEAFMNVEDALDELKAEFAKLMGDEEPMDDEMPADDMSDMVDAEEEDPLMMGGDDRESVEEEMDYEEIGEGASLKAVSDPSDPVGEDGSNQKSPVASKNDMGGKAVNITNDGSAGSSGAESPKLEDAGNVNTLPGKAGSTSSVSAPSNSSEKADSPISGKSL
tara:strand:+ start:238 stop:1092 length:855 start_codon:yes stop_codon:yes gene_type:complete